MLKSDLNQTENAVITQDQFMAIEVNMTPILISWNLLVEERIAGHARKNFPLGRGVSTEQGCTYSAL